MRDKLLFLGIEGITRFAIEYAKSIGAYTVVTDYNPPEKAPVKLLADEYWMVDIFDLDGLEKKCREENITGVFSGSNEVCLESTKELTKRLGLPFYASETGWACGRDKALFKEYCIKAGIDVPKRYMVHEPITAEMLDAIQGPVIVKPVDACAARGITVCRSRNKVEAAYKYALQFSESGNIIVEDFIEGEFMTAHFYLDEGKAYLTHANLSVMTVEGASPMESGTAIAKHKGYARMIQEQLSDKFQKLFDSMECKNGHIFVQGIPNNGKFYVFEMGYRLDGICDSTVTKPMFGFSAVEALVNLALGRKYTYNGESSLSIARECVGVMLMVRANPGKIEKIISEEVRATQGIDFAVERFKEGDEIHETKNMLQYAYFLSVVANSLAELVEKIKLINSKLQLLDKNGENLLVPFERFEALCEVLC